MPKLAPETRAERRRQLVDAAGRCLEAGGFQELTVDDVCAEAGVSKGAFYGYFDQKLDLLLALLQDEVDSMRAMMQGLEEASPSGVERLRRFTQAMVGRGDASGAHVRSELWIETENEPGVQELWVETVRERRVVLRGWIEDGVASGELADIPANALAAILLALGDGLSLHAGLDPSGFRWSNVAKALDALLAGIGRT